MKGILLLSAMAACLAAGALFGQSGGTMPRRLDVSLPVRMTIQTFRLPNGLNVILAPDTSVAVVAVTVSYHVGSGDEEPGRNGFADLFEHLMFQGSRHVGDDEHLRLIQETGGWANASAEQDVTNYLQVVPADFLERVLWLESDRMGFLPAALTEDKLNEQRSVVGNERRERYDNVPYGRAAETLAAALYPPGHPYSRLPSGSMADLDGVSLGEVEAFSRRYYVPNNASLAVAGNFDPMRTRAWVERYFGPIPAGAAVQRPLPPSPVRLDAEKRVVLRDQVRLPRLYVAWPTVAQYQLGEADLTVLAQVLAGGRNSRLERRLVHDEQIAQSVTAVHTSRALAGHFEIVVQPRPGVSVAHVLGVVDQELAGLFAGPPTEREVQRAVNKLEASRVQRLQMVVGRTDALNRCAIHTGDPACLQAESVRYASVTPAGVAAAARRYLDAGRVLLTVVPQGQPPAGDLP